MPGVVNTLGLTTRQQFLTNNIFQTSDNKTTRLVTVTGDINNLLMDYYFGLRPPHMQ